MTFSITYIEHHVHDIQHRIDNLISWIMSGRKQIGDTKGSYQIKRNNKEITEH